MKLNLDMPTVLHQTWRVLAVTSCLYTLSGCTWVKPVDRANEVAVVQASHVAQCQSVGTTRASVKDRLGILKRNPQKVSVELSTLAKNAAVSMGGDSIVEMSDVTDGVQEFAIYQCNK